MELILYDLFCSRMGYEKRNVQVAGIGIVKSILIHAGRTGITIDNQTEEVPVMVAVYELDNNRDVEQEWQEWVDECQRTWDEKAAELSTMGYARIPHDYFGSVFEKDGVKYYLSGTLGNTAWVVKRLPLRDGVDRVSNERERG
jgi:hypothetical protein